MVMSRHDQRKVNVRRFPPLLGAAPARPVRDADGADGGEPTAMVFTSYRIASLRKAEESLFASGLAWWQEWQEWHDLSTPGRPTTFEPRDVSTGPKTHVHMVRATAESADPNGMPLVCLHGFAHGTSCFYTAAAPLAEQSS